MVESNTASLSVRPEFSFQGRVETKERRVTGPTLQIGNCDSEDEFYDALENTQALNEAHERELLNSPTLRLARLYNRNYTSNSSPSSSQNKMPLEEDKEHDFVSKLSSESADLKVFD